LVAILGCNTNANGNSHPDPATSVATPESNGAKGDAEHMAIPIEELARPSSPESLVRLGLSESLKAALAKDPLRSGRVTWKGSNVKAVSGSSLTAERVREQIAAAGLIQSTDKMQLESNADAMGSFSWTPAANATARRVAPLAAWRESEVSDHVLQAWRGLNLSGDCEWEIEVSEIMGDILEDSKGPEPVNGLAYVYCAIAGIRIQEDHGSFIFDKKRFLSRFEFAWRGFSGIANEFGIERWKTGDAKELESAIRTGLPPGRNLEHVESVAPTWRIRGGKLEFGLEVFGRPPQGRGWNDFLAL
jgi:hypothetical protein